MIPLVGGVGSPIALTWSGRTEASPDDEFRVNFDFDFDLDTDKLRALLALAPAR